jgi:hypothetical protein
MAQVTEYLPSKSEALSLTLNTVQKQKKYQSQETKITL